MMERFNPFRLTGGDPTHPIFFHSLHQVVPAFRCMSRLKPTLTVIEAVHWGHCFDSFIVCGQFDDVSSAHAPT